MTTYPTYVLRYAGITSEPLQRKFIEQDYGFYYVEELVLKKSSSSRLDWVTHPSFNDWFEKIDQWETVDCKLKVDGVTHSYSVSRLS